MPSYVSLPLDTEQAAHATAAADVVPPARRSDEPKHSAPRTGKRRRLLFGTMPIVFASTIAMTLNLAAPAHADSLQKRQPKPKDSLPGQALTKGLAAATAATEIAPAQYTVVDGDTVSGIAGRFGLSTASVLALNGLGWSALIFPGQVLTLSTQAAPLVAAPAPTPVAAELTRHTVVSGDTISGIAAAHGLPASAVLAANGLDRTSIIFPGQAIVIPDAHAWAPAAAPVAAAPAPAAPAAATHTIASGDTISGVAAAAGVSVQAVLEANGLGWSSIIYPGQVLRMPPDAPVPVPAPVLASYVTPIVPTVLTDEMRANASIIVSTGRAAGVNDYGLVIALAAAAQESGLRNVQYGDRDSLGLFQQRPSAGWGAPEQVLDPARASRAFFGGAGNPNRGVTRGLLDIPGWESMTVTQAAQAVQISAYPDFYAKWEAPARAWLAELG
ncbi:LysM peptidoglycan-binding domain-containing protein [Glaciibacter sp. 2TAF33]|uniref:LysM peptidoglycan-binding domain-containing protein n=1 Tax=Glaciibacter sp. 2TAF33 TaxID=3233015 RepID=UPI003F92464F